MITKQRRGELFILSASFLWSWFPILIILGYSALTPLWSMGIILFISMIFFIIIISMRSLWHELTIKAAWGDLFYTSIAINLNFCLIFIALKYTTAGNQVVILYMQIFFSFLYFNIIGSDKISAMHLIGAIMMCFGALLILVPSTTSINIGDLLVLIAAAIFPIANHFQQRARKLVHSETILLVRNIIGVPVIVLMAVIFEPSLQWQSLTDVWYWLLISGILLFGLSKIFWIEALSSISITKATALTSLDPLFTLYLAWLILDEQFGLIQWAGIVPILLGGFFITRNNIASTMPTR